MSDSSQQKAHAVTGAFGFSGKYIATRLLNAGRRVVTFTNSPNRENPFAGKVEVRPFQFDSVERMTEALQDVEVLYNTYWVRFNHEKFNHSEAVRNTMVMFEAAKRAGVTRIVCTPHCRDPYFDYDKMWDAFELLRDNADGFPLQMGFEVNHRKLVELGIDAADHLHFDGTNEFLLELSTHADAYAFREYENTIYDLQCRGYQVIIAHPERYRAVQKDVSVAERLVDMGCKLQASADFIAGGRFGREKKPAQRLFDQNLYSFIASDAHNVGHYDCLAKARAKFSVRGAHFR